jgi:hypothetical protein
MKEVKRPDHIRVMGRDYSVVWEDDILLGTDNLGRTYSQQCAIAVRTGQHPVEEADTLLHEVMHAVWYCMSISEGGADEESVVRRMASGMMQVFMDNGHLLKYFADIYNLTQSGGKHEVRANKRGVSRPHGQRSGRGQCCAGELPQGK